MAWARGQKNEMTMTSIGVLYEIAATQPKKVAFIRDKEIWTYDRLAAEVDHLAHGLVERGLRKGDRVALHMANLPEFVVAYYACFRTGVIAAPLNIRLKTAELIPLLQGQCLATCKSLVNREKNLFAGHFRGNFLRSRAWRKLCDCPTARNKQYYIKSRYGSWNGPNWRISNKCSMSITIWEASKKWANACTT